MLAFVPFKGFIRGMSVENGVDAALPSSACNWRETHVMDEAGISAILPHWKRLQWYYSIELAPGLYTKGFEFSNLALTRRMI